jgi:hypothetical protein
MKLAQGSRWVAVPLLLGLVLTACDDQAADLSTTSSLLTQGSGPIGGEQPTTTTPAESAVTSGSILVGDSVDSYEVVARESTADGEILHIVIPQGAYTDVDLENFVGDLLESGAVTWGAEIFDDVVAADAFRKAEAERTEDEVALLEQHHFVSLLNGNTIRYQGPFEESGEIAIGS